MGLLGAARSPLGASYRSPLGALRDFECPSSITVTFLGVDAGLDPDACCRFGLIGARKIHEVLLDGTYVLPFWQYYGGFCHFRLTPSGATYRFSTWWLYTNCTGPPIIDNSTADIALVVRYNLATQEMSLVSGAGNQIFWWEDTDGSTFGDVLPNQIATLEPFFGACHFPVSAGEAVVVP